MLALTLPESEIKGFMNKLLREALFDGFDARSVVINTAARFEISAPPERCSWATLRPYAFNIIKGARKPSLIKLVLSMNDLEAETLFPEAKALFINIIFENETVMLTTGAAEKVFSLQKTLEHSWDSYTREFLKKNNIYYTE